MRRTLILSAATGLVLAAGGIAVAGTSGSSGASDGRQSGDVLRLVGKEVSSQFLDVGEAD